MKNKYKVSLLVIAILLAFSMTLGSSYAFWTTTVVQEGRNEVTAGCLEIELNDQILDELGNTISSNINLTNTFPMSDTKGITTKPYELTIKNTCTINAKYTVLLNVLSQTALNETNMKYHMVKTAPVSTTMVPALINTVQTVPLDLAIKNEIEDKMGSAIQNSYIIAEGVLNGSENNDGASDTYNLRLWIDESAGNEVMNSTFESAIAVYAEATN